MTAILAWIGGRARWILLIGAFAGLALPSAAALLRPFLPYLVAMVYALAMLRIDPIAVLRGFARPAHLGALLFLSLLMLAATPALGWAVVKALGLGPEYLKAVVYALAAAPIASAAAMCLIVGFDGRRALELTVLSSLALPAIGPAVTGALLGETVAIEPLALGLRIAGMIFGGFAAALVLRRLLGAERIARNAAALDGLASIGFLLFVLPLFDGVGPAIAADPGRALAFLAISALLILGTIRGFLALPLPRALAGATGAVWGTRSVAIYLAALPPDPVFTLFVAIYQLPMAAIPMAFRARARETAPS